VHADTERGGQRDHRDLGRAAGGLAAPAAVREEAGIEGVRRGPRQPGEPALAQQHVAHQPDAHRRQVEAAGGDAVGDRERHQEEHRAAQGEPRGGRFEVAVRDRLAARQPPRVAPTVDQVVVPAEHGLADEHGHQDQADLATGSAGERSRTGHPGGGEQRLARVRGAEQEDRRRVGERTAALSADHGCGCGLRGRPGLLRGPLRGLLRGGILDRVRGRLFGGGGRGGGTGAGRALLGRLRPPSTQAGRHTPQYRPAGSWVCLLSAVNCRADCRGGCPPWPATTPTAVLSSPDCAPDLRKR
jgi:hypothetical protein